jgi:Ca2+-binding EF-hand superfamily protein
LENLKRDLENSDGYNDRNAFKAIDEHRFHFINESNLKTFLRKMGHQVIKPELIAIIRRLDLDGDSKITF